MMKQCENYRNTFRIIRYERQLVEAHEERNSFMTIVTVVQSRCIVVSGSYDERICF